ncbi:hypothetical protein BC936DRAFT_142368 [Jimgerdemannia flammicorona]|uniref:Uncharacterized protein n=1 Tax=Jimgerdemannia flammicorona TaxID=994334 RepID=A0A433DF68_9FUNG|nr:hypothetical protein BC936DRAFT_142368 [Jimgerdemannia flammicorona]
MWELEQSKTKSADVDRQIADDLVDDIPPAHFAYDQPYEARPAVVVKSAVEEFCPAVAMTESEATTSCFIANTPIAWSMTKRLSRQLTILNVHKSATNILQPSLDNGTRTAVRHANNPSRTKAAWPKEETIVGVSSLLSQINDKDTSILRPMQESASSIPLPNDSCTASSVARPVKKATSRAKCALPKSEGTGFVSPPIPAIQGSDSGVLPPNDANTTSSNARPVKKATSRAKFARPKSEGIVVVSALLRPIQDTASSILPPSDINTTSSVAPPVKKTTTRAKVAWPKSESIVAVSPPLRPIDNSAGSILPRSDNNMNIGILPPGDNNMTVSVLPLSDDNMTIDIISPSDDHMTGSILPSGDDNVTISILPSSDDNTTSSTLRSSDVNTTSSTVPPSDNNATSSVARPVKKATSRAKFARSKSESIDVVSSPLRLIHGNGTTILPPIYDNERNAVLGATIGGQSQPQIPVVAPPNSEVPAQATGFVRPPPKMAFSRIKSKRPAQANGVGGSGLRPPAPPNISTASVSQHILPSSDSSMHY